MATMQQEREMRNLAKRIERDLKKMYGMDMGFFIVTVPFGNGSMGVSDYIGNVHRKEGIEMMRATADRLETNQTIPAAQGEA